MSAPPNPEQFVAVPTSLPVRPLPPNSARAPIVTERLVLRPFAADDLEAFHVLRTQPEVMIWTSHGRVDADLDETQMRLDPFLPPNDGKTYNFAICLRDTRELIGVGGCHMFRGEFGWPEIGYMFKKEHWGKGLATEFLKAFMEAWAKLPREEVIIEVDPRFLVGGKDGSDGVRVEEQTAAITEDANKKSQRILEKCGFEHVMTWTARETKTGDKLVELPTFRCFPTRKLETMSQEAVEGKLEQNA